MTTTANPNPRGELDRHNRERVALMFQGKSDAEKFTALMLMGAAPPEHTAAILDQIRGTGTDLERRLPEVGNRPLRQFAGKTRAQLVRELGDEKQVDFVLTALTGAGLDVSDHQAAPTASGAGEATGAAPEKRLPMTSPALHTGAVHVGTAGAVEPTFGTEQLPASEIWHLTDDDLKQVDGVTPADIQRIRQLKAASDFRARAAASHAPNATAAAGVVHTGPATLATSGDAATVAAEAKPGKPAKPATAAGPAPAGPAASASPVVDAPAATK